MGSAETIFAPATGPGAGAISVFRVTGSAAHACVDALISGPLPALRRLSRRPLIGADGALLDDAMVVLFPEGQSFTGEAMAELHCHGGRAVLSAVTDALLETGLCRLADPGEFSRRAFENERMSLAEAEGIADLIASETESQRQQALRLMSGELNTQAQMWRRDLIHARALLEVTIDWVDEDVPEDVYPEVTERLLAVRDGVAEELRRSEKAERLRDGLQVALIGPPNSGKSSLLNALAGRKAALTSTEAGTTRDVIETRYDLFGLPVRFLDTAGIRETTNMIERAGIELARDRAKAADLRVLVTSVDTEVDDDVRALLKAGDLTIANKGDLFARSDGALVVSSKTGDGVNSLLQSIHERLSSTTSDVGLLGHLRTIAAAKDAFVTLDHVIRELRHVPTEVVSLKIGIAAAQLEMLLGRVGTEDVLDAVFGNFCLGK